MQSQTLSIEEYAVLPADRRTSICGNVRISLNSTRGTFRTARHPSPEVSAEPEAHRHRPQGRVANQPRVQIGQTHFIGAWPMAELLDDRGQVLMVVPLPDAVGAVAASRE